MKSTQQKNIRGSALTELLILTFPYAMILIGISVLGMISLGKQETIKASMLATPWPDRQSKSDINALTFIGMDTNPKIKIDFDEETDFTPEQRYADQEPILPYTDSNDSGAKNDIHAGFVRIGTNARSSTTIKGGEVTVNTTVEKNGIGNYLENFSIMPDREDDIAAAMNGWIDYSKATAKFSYTYGGKKQYYEKLAAGSDIAPNQSAHREKDPRKEFVLRDHDGNEGIKSYSASRTDKTRGTHGGNFGHSNIDLNAINELPSIVTNFKMRDAGTTYRDSGTGYNSWSVLNDSNDWNE